MSFTVDIEDNSPLFKEAVRRGIAAAMEEIGVQAESNVADITPVGTPESTGKPGYIGGTLKGSIDHAAQGDTVHIGTDVEYAPYVEFGTYKMKAKPYLKPGIMNNMSQYEEIAKEQIEAHLP